MQKVRYHIRFIGRVQGVGFRYTVNSIALSLGITGWVLNDWDGSVILEAQGTEQEISELINQIANAPFIEIENLEKTQMCVDKTEKSFQVRY